MRLVYAGTPDFAVPALTAIVAAGHEVALVLSQPDRPSGRGMRLMPTPVSAAAVSLGLPTSKPTTLRAESVCEVIRATKPDILVVAAYGLVLPPPMLAIAPKGCLNIHASLLPRWRGAAPIQRAILAGDEETGVCIMQMEAGLDTGPVLLEERVRIEPRDTTGVLSERLARIGADAIVRALSQIDRLPRNPQKEEGVTYAHKIARSESGLDWSYSSATLDRAVRAFNPAPGAEGIIAGQRVKIWEAEPVKGAQLEPGEMALSPLGDLIVGCRDGALLLKVVQRPGGKRMSSRDYLRGHSNRPPVAL